MFFGKIWHLDRGGYHNLNSENFCHKVSENFVGEPFCVLENFSYRDRMEYHDFSSESFCLTVSENFVGEPFRFFLEISSI